MKNRSTSKPISRAELAAAFALQQLVCEAERQRAERVQGIADRIAAGAPVASCDYSFDLATQRVIEA